MENAVRNVVLKDVKQNDRVEGTYLVKYKALQVGRTGKSYLNIVLMDRTGELEARIWDGADQAAGLFEKDDFVAVRAKAQDFQGRIQLNVFEIRRVAEQDVELADYLPATSKNIETMYGEVRAIILDMKDIYLRSLLLAFVDDPGLDWRIKRAPAAKAMHHPFVGGLLEHTLSAMKLMKLVAGHYQREGYDDINEDLLITGIFLHDIGKIFELSYTRSFDYSDAGKLVGHFIIGIELVNERAARIPGFPEELRLLVQHLILAHHGKLEYGSPKRPKTIEALIVHAVDDLDAQVNCFSLALAKERDSENSWTSFNRLYERFLWKKPYVSDGGPA